MPYSRRAAAVPILLVLIVAFLLVPKLHATTIAYVATDLADVMAGEDLWRYDYTVSGRTFLQSEFFDIYFDPLLFGLLMAGPAPNADWDVAILQQPAPLNFPPFDVGIFDAFSLVNDPSLAGTFSATFVYLGQGSPGAQPFAIFEASGNVLESALTSQQVQAIPEPSTVMLLVLPLALLGVKFCRASRT